MSTPTFTEALTRAEAQARSTLVPALHERLTDAVTLVKDGRVFQATDGTWQVDSASTEGLVHSINGSCDCSDVHYNKPPQGLCKHRLSVYLARRVYQLMAAPTPEEGSLKDTTPLPEVPRNSDTPALPEAPASVNCHLTIAGRQVQLTLRDTDEARLLARLASVLEQYPMPQPAPQASSQGQEWCAVHHVVMKDNNKDGRRWFSHRLENGTWCKGR